MQWDSVLDSAKKIHHRLYINLILIIMPKTVKCKDCYRMRKAAFYERSFRKSKRDGSTRKQ
jgi:hypothetical protein